VLDDLHAWCRRQVSMQRASALDCCLFILSKQGGYSEKRAKKDPAEAGS
jgi:hypothetical protein